LFDFVIFSAAELQVFLLLIIRASGLLLAAPILGHASLPVPIKAGLVILFAIITFPSVDVAAIPAVGTNAELAALVVRELMVGVLLGFFFSLLFRAAELAGAMAGFQVGLAISQAFDPSSGGQVSVIGRFWILIASLIFLAINGHHLIISAFNDSLRVIPPGMVPLRAETAELVMKYSAYVFVLAVKIAAPVLVTLILMDVALGTIAKMMPTMNIFIVGFPLKIGIGMVVVAVSLPIVAYVLEKSTSYFNHAVNEMMLTLSGA